MFFLIVEISVLFFCFLVALHLYIQYGRTGRMLSKIPGPPEKPIIGNILDLAFLKPENLIPHMKSIMKIYYPALKLWGGTLSGVVIYSPDDAETILTSHKHIEKSSLYKFLRPWLGDGLLLSKGSKWHARRKILTHAFHFNVLQMYFPVLIEHGNHLVNALKEGGEEKIVEITPIITYHSLSAICETAMGISLDVIDKKTVEEYREAVFFFGEQIVHRVLRPWHYSDFIFDNLTMRGWQQRKAVKILHEFSQKIIRERTEYHQKTGGKYLKDISTTKEELLKEDVDVIKGKKKRMAMLDLLIAASWDGLIDEKGIAEEVDTFVFEGHDTSAMALIFILQLLAEHEDIQERARQEVNSLWTECGGKFNINSLNKIPYLERCIRESLRLYPSVHFISRAMPEDLKFKNFTVPTGTMVDVYIQEIHMDPNYWPDPHKFDPDRFLPEKILERHPFCYVPFSGGPRNCIGQKFAMMELKIFTMHVLRNFRMKAMIATKDIGQMPDLVYRPLRKVEIEFIAIDT